MFAGGSLPYPERIEETCWESLSFRDAEPHTPQIFEPQATRIPPRLQWHPRWLKNELSNRPVWASFSDTGEYGFKPEVELKDAGSSLDYEVDRKDLHWVLDEVLEPTQSPFTYLIDHRLETVFPEIAAQALSPRYLRHCQPIRSLWMGSRGTYSPLHFDATSSILNQKFGKKRISLFPPHNMKFFRMFPREAQQAHCCYSLHRQELDVEFVRDRSGGMVFDLEPGQALFIPAFWLHSIANLEASISVHIRWIPATRRKQLPETAAALIPAWYRTGQLSKRLEIFHGGEKTDLLSLAEQRHRRSDFQNAALLALSTAEAFISRRAASSGQQPGVLETIKASNDLMREEEVAMTHAVALMSLAKATGLPHCKQDESEHCLHAARALQRLQQ